MIYFVFAQLFPFLLDLFTMEVAELRAAHGGLGIHRVSLWENECLNKEYR